jgi:TPR repeat protein
MPDAPDDATRAFQAGDLTTAERLWRAAGDDGDPAALTGLGAIALQRGEPDEARRLWEAAALAGDRPAMVNLALLAETGADTASARVWLERAGTADAQFQLGRIAYEQGAFAEAERWWRAAAEAGDDRARDHLQVVASGAGRQQAVWERLAERDRPQAMWNLGLAAVERGDLAGVRDWWGRAGAADTGIAAELGAILGCAADEATAGLAGLPDGALAGILGALCLAAERPATARVWWVIAADAGNATAMHDLAVLALREGDHATGVDWCRRAAEAGDDDARALLERL